MMKSLKIKNSRQNLILAVVFSVAIHFALAVPLFYKLSGNLSFSESLNKINLVWVNLETKNSALVAKKVLRPVAAVSRNNAAQKDIAIADPEISGAGQEAAGQTAAASSAGADTLSGYDGFAAATLKTKVHNLSGNAPVEKAGSLPATETADAYPLYRENVPPVYPEIARIRGYEGIVLVAAEILPDGSVGNMKIRKSSGHPVLDQSAVTAVKPWKFEPAKKSGKPFAVWVELPIKFVLQDDNSQS